MLTYLIYRHDSIDITCSFYLKKLRALVFLATCLYYLFVSMAFMYVSSRYLYKDSRHFNKHFIYFAKVSSMLNYHDMSM